MYLLHWMYKVLYNWCMGMLSIFLHAPAFIHFCTFWIIHKLLALIIMIRSNQSEYFSIQKLYFIWKIFLITTIHFYNSILYKYYKYWYHSRERENSLQDFISNTQSEMDVVFVTNRIDQPISALTIMRLVGMTWPNKIQLPASKYHSFSFQFLKYFLNLLLVGNLEQRMRWKMREYLRIVVYVEIVKKKKNDENLSRW